MPATTFERVQNWRAAVDNWRRHLRVEETRAELPDRLMMTVFRSPTQDDASTAFVICIDPRARADGASYIFNRSGIAEIRRKTKRLADTIAALTPPLKRHQLLTEEAAELPRALRRRKARPTLDLFNKVIQLGRQVETLEHLIWRGDLTAEEDTHERIAFWNDKLAKLRTPEGHRRFSAYVTEILSLPRNPDHELLLLDSFATEGQRELLLLSVEPTRRTIGNDTLSVCSRWRRLTAIGQRHFARHDNAETTISFRSIVDQLSLCGVEGENVPSLELEWAKRLRLTTEALRPLADGAGFSAGERIPITNMLQALDKLLLGDAMDYTRPVEDVRDLVDEIVAQALRSRKDVINRVFQIVRELRDNVSELLKLIGGSTATADLTLLDHYLANLDTNEMHQGPGSAHDVAWCTLTQSLKANLEQLQELVEHEFCNPERSIKHDLAQIGNAKARIGGVNGNSYHDLVHRVAGIVATHPEHERVPNAHQGEHEIHPLGKPKPRVARLDVIRELVKSGWPEETGDELEREHADALNLGDCDEVLVSVAEASVRLGVAERTIRNWIKRKSNELNPVDQLGGPRSTASRYRLSDIAARQPADRDAP